MSETVAQIADRLGMTEKWVRTHTFGFHRCLDGRRYAGNDCLVTDPQCHYLAKQRLAELLDEDPGPGGDSIY